MLKAILFDLDNTLIDFLTFKIETAKVAAKAMVHCGLPANEIETYGKIFSIYDQHGIEYQKTFYEVVKSFNLDINLAEKIQQAAIIAYLKKKFEVLRPCHMVKPTLEKLKTNYKLAIVTDAPRNKTWQRLILTGLENQFDIVVTYEDTLEKKPSKSPYYLALQKLNVLAPSCLFVGDNPQRDILGAKEIGMNTCLARYGLWNKSNKNDTIKADYEIQKFEDLLEVVNSLI